MLNPFDKKKYLLEEDQSNKEPFDKRIKQIEQLRKDRLIQLEQARKIAQDDLDQASKMLNQKRRETIEHSLYYSVLPPIIEQKFLYIDANVPGVTKWAEQVKLMRQKLEQTYSVYQTHIDEWKVKQQQLEQSKQQCQQMLVKTEKLALLETIYNENGGI